MEIEVDLEVGSYQLTGRTKNHSQSFGLNLEHPPSQKKE